MFLLFNLFFLIVMLMLMYAFTVLALLQYLRFSDCLVDVDVDNVQRRKIIHFYGV